MGAPRCFLAETGDTYNHTYNYRVHRGLKVVSIPLPWMSPDSRWMDIHPDHQRSFCAGNLALWWSIRFTASTLQDLATNFLQVVSVKPGWLCPSPEKRCLLSTVGSVMPLLSVTQLTVWCQPAGSAALGGRPGNWCQPAGSIGDHDRLLFLVRVPCKARATARAATLSKSAV